MAQILKLIQAPDNGTRQKLAVPLRLVRSELPDNEADVFWLETSKGLWSTQPEDVNSENAQSRVLTEMVTILGGACLLILLSITFFGTPYA